jgi:hypothetical protein
MANYDQRSRITVSYGIKDNDFRFGTDVKFMKTT